MRVPGRDPTSALRRRELPAETTPRFLRGFAEHQPITPLVETLRALLLGHCPGTAAITASAWIAGTVAVSIPIAAVLFRRRTSG